MEEKAIKKLLKDQTKEIERHQKMLLEEFQRQLSIIAEVQTDHTKKFDGLIEMVAKNTEDIELIKEMLRRKVNVEEFEALGIQVAILEKKLKVLWKDFSYFCF